MLSPPDRQLAEEFRHNPCGCHSEALKRLLEVFRGAPMPGKYVLIELQAHGPWQVGRLGATRGAPIERLEQATFASLADAEWFVFQRRWEEHFGQSLNDPHGA